MLSAKQIEPGQSGQIEVSLKTDGAAGSTLHKSVTVICNDPLQPNLVLGMSATVEAEFQLSDRSIYFGSIPKGQEAVKELLITIPENKPLKVLSAEVTDPGMAVKLEAIPGTNQKKIKAIVTLKADAKDGYHFANIIIKTSSTLAPELRISARGNVSASPGGQ